MKKRWPSFAEYSAWALAQGCVVTSTAVMRGGGPLHIITITAPSGATAIEIIADAQDMLMSTTIARLDRRLGMKSYLFQ